MSSLAIILAGIGIAALVGRFFRAGLRAAMRVAEVTAAKGLVEISLRRGDLTGLAERRAAERTARRRRRKELVIGSLWGLWLLIPLFTPWALETYAIAAPLWLIRAAPAEKRYV